MGMREREKKGTEKEVIEGKFHGAILRHVCELKEGRGEGKIKGEEEESRRKSEEYKERIKKGRFGWKGDGGRGRKRRKRTKERG